MQACSRFWDLPSARCSYFTAPRADIAVGQEVEDPEESSRMEEQDPLGLREGSLPELGQQTVHGLARIDGIQ